MISLAITNSGDAKHSELHVAALVTLTHTDCSLGVAQKLFIALQTLLARIAHSAYPSGHGTKQ